MNEASVELLKENVRVKREKSDILYNGIKRIFDIVFAIVSIILLLPVFIITTIIIKLDSKGKVIFKHKRIGKNGQVIYLYKFRTMYSNSEEIFNELMKDPKRKKEWETYYKLSNDPRITRIGKFLRKSSLDELPQLFNILSGEMSFVGPRPLVEKEIEKYGKNKNKLLSVIPGLTGWWACNGRSCTSYEDRMKLELYYVEHKSIKLDLKVIFKTFVTVLKRTGAE